MPACCVWDSERLRVALTRLKPKYVKLAKSKKKKKGSGSSDSSGSSGGSLKSSDRLRNNVLTEVAEHLFSNGGGPAVSVKMAKGLQVGTPRRRAPAPALTQSLRSPTHSRASLIHAHANRAQVEMLDSRGHWMGGVVVKVLTNSEKKVKAEFVRPAGAKKKKKVKLEAGARVEARFKKKEDWLPGIVTNARSDGTFDIQYDSVLALTMADGSKEKDVKAANVRPVHHFKAGDLVQAVAEEEDDENWFFGEVAVPALPAPPRPAPRRPAPPSPLTASPAFLPPAAPLR